MQSPGMDRERSLMSQLCVEKDPRKYYEQLLEETPTIELSQETKSRSTQWTDEKHSLYLKSMEASFVNQLYDSLDTLEPKSSRETNNGIPTPSGQFKVFKDGSWARVNCSNFGREMPPPPKKPGKSDPILANPWIQHYMSSARHKTRISPCPQGEAPLPVIVNSSAFQFSCQDSIGSDAEVTDQNFVDEVPGEEKPSRRRRQKCRKISAVSGLSNDQVQFLLKSFNENGKSISLSNLMALKFILQVVPFAKLSLIDDIVELHCSPKE